MKNIVLVGMMGSGKTTFARALAKLRLDNPDVSLIELGKMLQEPVGKSGVNYRLKKIVDLAKNIYNY